MSYTKFQDTSIKDKYFSYPLNAKKILLEVRELIFVTANKTKGVGKIQECLKWNEPSFVTFETKSGSTFRIDWKAKDPENIHFYVNCQTKLISIYKEIYQNDFEFEGNRCVKLPINKRIPKRKLSKMIEIALTYNLKNYKYLLSV